MEDQVTSISKGTSVALRAVAFSAFAGLFMLISCEENNNKEPWETEIDQLQEAVSAFSDLDDAIAEGYDNEFTGYRSQMGFHYLKASLLDEKFEVGKPEVMMFAPGDNGDLRFVGVEYAVPVSDLNNPPPAPQGFTGENDVWEINEEFSVWTLHVWIGLDNPHGIFASHNPELP